MTSKIIIDVIDKLIGDFIPSGETFHDIGANDNLELLCEVISHYIDRIYRLTECSKRNEYSIRKCGIKAEEFFKDLAEYIYVLEEGENEIN